MSLPALAEPAGPPAPSSAGSPASLMDKLDPDQGCGSNRLGPYPTSSYRIDYDPGVFTDLSSKANGSITELLFDAVHWLVFLGTWIVRWAFSFGFADKLARPAAELALQYRRNVFLPLVTFCLVLSAGYGGWQIFRGRLSRGAGELALSVVLAGAFSVWLIADPGAFLRSSFETTARLSGSVASLAFTQHSGACSAQAGSFAIAGYGSVVAPINHRIHQAFVEEPYEMIQWGDTVRPQCKPERDAVLAAGQSGNRDEVVAMMDVPGCQDLYQFNRQASAERLGLAALTFFAALIAVGALVLVAVTVVVAQLVAVALIALMPLAALASALPGSGRHVTWRWLSTLLRAFLGILAMSVLLTFMMIGINALLAATEGQSLLVRTGMLNMVGVVTVASHKKLAHAGHNVAAGIGRRLEVARLGGAGRSAGWMPQPKVGGLGGFAFAAFENVSRAWSYKGMARMSRSWRHEVKDTPHEPMIDREIVDRVYRMPAYGLLPGQNGEQHMPDLDPGPAVKARGRIPSPVMAHAGARVFNLESRFIPAFKYLDRHRRVTNGTETIDETATQDHDEGSAEEGKSTFYPHIDSWGVLLDAAQYLRHTGASEFDGKKKVYMKEPVGILGRTGQPTHWVNIYMNKNGFIHGCPGRPPKAEGPQLSGGPAPRKKVRNKETRGVPPQPSAEIRGKEQQDA